MMSHGIGGSYWNLNETENIPLNQHHLGLYDNLLIQFDCNLWYVPNCEWRSLCSPPSVYLSIKVSRCLEVLIKHFKTSLAVLTEPWWLIFLCFFSQYFPYPSTNNALKMFVQCWFTVESDVIFDLIRNYVSNVFAEIRFFS